MIKYEFYKCKSIINFYDKDDIFIGSINPYQGCIHSCKYCYVQSEKYTPFKDKPESLFKIIRVKENAAFLLKQTLEKIPPGILCLGSSSDPYQIPERNFLITRKREMR